MAVYDVVCLGEPLVEFNQPANSDHYLRGFGGDVSNFAVAAARQQASAAMITALGDDEAGRALRAMWDTEGVDHSHVRSDSRGFTGAYFVKHSVSGHGFSFLREGSVASRIKPEDLPAEVIKSAKILHLSAVTLAISTDSCDTAYAAVHMAKAAGVCVSFDTNLRLKLWPLPRARALIRDFISQSDICLPSFDDIAQVAQMKDPEGLVDYCLDLGAQTVALKLGAGGALVANSQARFKIAAYPCAPVDATGAGDTFGGCLIARLLAGDGLQLAAQYAAAAAACSTEHYGAVAGIPRPAEVRRRMGESSVDVREPRFAASS